MFCLLENNYVVDGPYDWNSRKFQMILNDDHDINFSLPLYNSEVIVINDNLKLVPAFESIPAYNAKIQQLSGRELTVNEDSVTVTYAVLDKALETVKAELKAIVASSRYAFEVGGTSTIINDVTLSLSTDRESRTILAQALQLGAFDKNWKFGDVWLTLNQEQLVHVVTAIAEHVQSAYDWEKSVIDAIDAANDLQTLDVIVTFK
jgi:hypothetical protein